MLTLPSALWKWMRITSNDAAAPGCPRPDEDMRRLRWHRRICLLSALLIVPPFLGLVAVLGAATHLRYLLYPPLVAIGYDLFTLDPRGLGTSLRNAVVAPIVGALLGVMAIAWLPAGSGRVMAVTFAAMLVVGVLKVVQVPALSVALLTLLVGDDSILYVFSVAASALTLTLLFRVWRRLIYLRLFADLPAPRSQLERRLPAPS